MLHRRSLHWLLLAAAACVTIPGAASPAGFDDIDADADTASVRSVDFDPTRALAQIGDPAIETVDEMTEGSGGGRGGAGPSRSGNEAPRGPLRRNWSEVRDPAIETVDEQTDKSSSSDAAWYEKINIRGYTQFRINSLLWNDPDLAPPYHPHDRSVSPDNHFYIRRCRVIFSGDMSDRLFFYIQPDFASSLVGVSDPGAINYAQLRDCYGDVYLTTDRVHRVRVGQSKVPYGWENLQSSSNRVPLDRADYINATKSERGLGVFYYWTPEYAQELYKEVLDEGLKGSGNYGVAGIGTYNGQGNSALDQNNNLHTVIRLNSPWKMPSGQIMEAGVQAYTGLFVPTVSTITLPNGTKVTPVVDDNGVLDQRICATYVYYPQKLGFIAEWNVGLGPALSNLSNASPANPPTITSKPLSGGYILVNYKADTERLGVMFPYFRWQMGRGGYIWERNSPYAYLGEFNLGLEWQITPQMELTMEYDWVNRTSTAGNAPINQFGQYAQFQGDLLRFQFQINY